MIPSTTHKLLVSEDWKKIYQSFRNADFKSYDFETLRRTMITYLRENYPEEFNDYIDSSEYIALVDLIAYLGQNLSFRIDLNARENFLETAERRDSILRLARLINYNAKRNIPANGFLKILSISTSDNVIDGNGTNIANQIVSWNDPTNTNWYQQFVSILNNAMPGGVVFGRPYDKATIGGIEHQQYRLNSSNTDIPVYSFNTSINGTGMTFEVVSSIFTKSSYVYEEPPRPGNMFSFIYKNDNQGNSSSNTGFFLHFKQGAMNVSNFTIDTAVPNELIGINAPDINDTDIWLWQLTSAGTYDNLWTKVSDLVGNNIIYNSVNSDIKNVYSVLTRENDQIDLSFSDGSFGNLPKGQFSLFYRQSNGLSYVIKPNQMSNITISIPYTNKVGQLTSLNIVASLQDNVTNAVVSESNDEIKTKAPQSFYVQNRMVTGEDYNIAPLTAGNDILKIKSINRLSSGISKYFELSDISGQYSRTNIFSNDGIIYKEYPNNSFEFSFTNQTEILGTIRNYIASVVASNEMRSFYIDQYPRITTLDAVFVWRQTQKTTNQNKGYFSVNGIPSAVGDFSGNSLQYLKAGALIKFTPPTGSYFLPNNNITKTADATTKEYIWVKVVGVVGDGFNSGSGVDNQGIGPITLTGNVPSGAIPTEIIPKFANVLSTGIQSEIANICASKKNLGLSFDSVARSWFIITDGNLDLINDFSLSFQQDTTNVGKDKSWLIAFEWTGRNYKVRYRTLDYIFESVEETAFFVDNTKKNYDFINDTVVKDQIKVLAVNQSSADTTLVTKASAIVPSLITTATSSATNVTSDSTTLWFTSTWLVYSGLNRNYNVIHPNISSGASSVFSVIDATTSTTSPVSIAVTLANTLSNKISTGSYITFVPKSINAVNTFTFSSAEINQHFSLGKDYNWQVDSAIVESDGYVNPKKVKVSFFDFDDDGQIDDPDMFLNIVKVATTNPVTGYKDKFVYFKKLSDGQRYQLATEEILAYPTELEVNVTPTNGQLFYFYDPDVNVIKSWSAVDVDYILQPDYFAYYGRKDLKFHYMHNSGQDRRLDPSKTNLIEIYLLTKSYDTEYRNWLAFRSGDEPMSPTSSSLEENYSASLEPIKSISDELVFLPTKYKVLFGDIASLPLQGTFKAVRNSTKPTSDNDLKTRILMAIENFFSIENWEFGQTFYFSELATYVMNELTPDITNFVIVPKSVGGFGSLYEITCESNEIFINGATANDIEIIDAITASELKAISSVVSNTAGG